MPIGKGVGRQRRSDGTSYKWKGFLISRVVSRGEWVGLGASCLLHKNVGDGQSTVCQKQLTFGSEPLSVAEVELRLKRWLVAGKAISVLDGEGRTKHRDIDARALAPGKSNRPEASMTEAQLAAAFDV